MLVADERVTVCNIFPDQAYIAAIFHDCGVLLQLQRFPTYCAEMRLEEPGRWVHLADEDRKFNADHCVVGYIVARHWCLPDFISDAIRFHHDGAQLENHRARTMVAILQLASELYYREQRVPNPEWDLVKHEVLPELGLDEDALLEFADIVMERYHIEAPTS
jgi:HD-like signal output (HDOD) protein